MVSTAVRIRLSQPPAGLGLGLGLSLAIKLKVSLVNLGVITTFTGGFGSQKIEE